MTVYRWVQRFTPLLADAARFARHAPGERWFVHDTYVKVNGVWRCVYRAVDQHGQVIDVVLSARRDAAAARQFFTRAPRTLKAIPSEVVTHAAPVYPAVLEEPVPAAWHHVEQYANNRIEADHGQLKRRLRPMRGLQTNRPAQVAIVGQALVQNVRRGHYELEVAMPAPHCRPPQRSPNSPKQSGLLCDRAQRVHRSGNATGPRVRATRPRPRYRNDKQMILCSHFAPKVRSNMRTARYRQSGNEPLTCTNDGGRYWDRTSDLSGVNGALSR